MENDAQFRALAMQFFSKANEIKACIGAAETATFDVGWVPTMIEVDKLRVIVEFLGLAMVDAQSLRDSALSFEAP